MNELEVFEAISNPANFAERVLGLQLFPYQREYLLDRHPRKALRWGRRAGKSVALAAEMLWFAFTRKKVRVLYIAPQTEHLEETFTEIFKLVDSNQFVKSSVLSQTKTKQSYQLTLKNGSIIRGRPEGSKGLGLRGKGCHFLVVDEAAYIKEDGWKAISGITMDKAEVIFAVASTPNGPQGKFFDYCNSERFHESHVSSTMSPSWSAEKEADARVHYVGVDYIHEILAEWGEKKGSVFTATSITAMIDDDRSDYRYTDQELQPNELGNIRKVMGVDWDKYQAGPTIAILGVFGDVVLTLAVINIERTNFAYTEAVQRIIDLNTLYDPEWIYADAGSGERNIEDLILYGINHPETRLHEKVVRCTFNSKIKTRDPFGAEIEKPFKQFMVSNTTLFLEGAKVIRGRLFWSRHDLDTTKQFRDYSITTISDSGPKFSKMNEHTIDAIGLGLLAIVEKMRPDLREPIPYDRAHLATHVPLRKTSVSLGTNLDNRFGIVARENKEEKPANSNQYQRTLPSYARLPNQFGRNPYKRGYTGR